MFTMHACCDLMAPGLTMQTHRRTTQSHITGRKVKIHCTRHNISSLGEFPHPKNMLLTMWSIFVDFRSGPRRLEGEKKKEEKKKEETLVKYKSADILCRAA